jgi:RNA polymerase sigma factor (sigma-70 family)
MDQLIVDNINFMKKGITRNKELIPHEETLKLARLVQNGLNEIENHGFKRSYENVSGLLSNVVVCVGLNARNKLIIGNLRFALKKAYQYNGSSLNSLDDVVQAVNLKLAEAIEKYDPSKGFKITTYIDFHIKQAVFNEKKKHQATSMKVSTHLLQIKYTYTQRYEKQRQKLGRCPSRKEMAELYKVSESVLTNALAIPMEVSIFELKGKNEEGESLMVVDSLESPNYLENAAKDLSTEYKQSGMKPGFLGLQQMLYPELFGKLRANERLGEEDLLIVNQILANISKHKI